MRRLAAGSGRMTGTAGRRGRRRWDAEQALTAAYDRHYQALTQLAALLVDDIAVAEGVVQAAFAALYGAGRQPPDSGTTLFCLRRAVISRARAHRAAHPSQRQDARQAQAGGDSVLLALRALPDLQREALILHYYADLADDQVASAMGIGARSVHVHISRGVAALQTALDGRGSSLPPHWPAQILSGWVIEARPRGQDLGARRRQQDHQPVDPDGLVTRPASVNAVTCLTRPGGLLDSAIRAAR